uniref:Protein krueppel n=1 Tax=Anopheles culicifacies TaxID=139723 RepID=A0A182MUT1_9DIPT
MASFGASCCRLCLNNPPPESLVFSVFDTFQGNVLSELIDELFNIKVLADDRLLSLCLECVNRINTVHKIKQLFVENDRKLHELHQTNLPPSDAFVEEFVYTTFPTETLDNSTSNNKDEGSAFGRMVEIEQINVATITHAQPCTASVRISTDEETNDTTTGPCCDTEDNEDTKINSKHGDESPSSTTNIRPSGQPSMQLPRNKCYFCGVTFESSLKFTQHLPSHFNDVPYTCTECNGLVFKTVREASKHISYHDATERPFQCRICTLRFPTRMNSLTHERKMHRLKLKRMEAKQTNGSAIKRNTSGRRTKPMCAKDQKRPKTTEKLAQHSCEMCDKKFTAKKNLTRHLMIHTGEKPFKCDRCDRSFRQAGELKKHRNVHFAKQPASKAQQTNSNKATGRPTRPVSVPRDRPSARIKEQT